MNSEELKGITQQLADVEPPPTPDWQPLIEGATVVIVAILLTVVVIYRRSRQKHSGTISDSTREALYQLQLLQQAWQEGEVDDHDAAYRLSTLLRLGLGLNQLTETPPPSFMDQQPQWQALMQQLTKLRYTPADNATPLTADAFAQVETWLKQGQTPC